MGCTPKFCTINAKLVGGVVSSVALPVFAKQFETNGVAINGTDPVAYFSMSKPVQGSADHALNWNGVTLHFASDENRQMFEGDPEKYAPQYGGQCSLCHVLRIYCPHVARGMDDL